MSNTLLEQLAFQITREVFLENWKFYAILASLVVLSTLISTYLSKYVGKRAEVYATKSDLGELLRQLEATTELTEQVKTAVSHADWLAREWKAIRRTKLEELVESATSLPQWFDHQRSVHFFQSKQKNPSPPADRVYMLVALYFPEMQSEGDALLGAQNAAFAWLTNTASLSHSVSGLHERSAFLESGLTDWLPLHAALTTAVDQVRIKAAKVMLQMRST